MKTKITHLTSAHPRYDTRIFLKECSSLAKNEDYEVNLVVADGLGDESKNYVNILDIGAKEGGRLSRMTKTVKKVFEKAKDLDSDIYHLHDPELIPIGLKLKKLGKKVIFDIHENTDLQILEKEWIPLFLRHIIARLYRRYEDRSSKKFDLLIVPQESMYLKYKKLSKTTVVGNFPNKIKELKSEDLKIQKYNLLYSGAISEARGLWNMLELIIELVELDNQYTLTIAGMMDNKLLLKAQKHKGWKYTNYLGMLSKDEIYERYKENSIGLILFNNVGQYYMAYSLKLFEYMQNGMCVVMPNFGDWIVFNDKYQVGYNVSTGDSQNIAKVIHNIRDDKLIFYAKHNINSVSENFSWESQEKKLFQFYKELINANKI